MGKRWSRCAAWVTMLRRAFSPTPPLSPIFILLEGWGPKKRGGAGGGKRVGGKGRPLSKAGGRGIWGLAPGEAFGERKADMLHRVSRAVRRQHGVAAADPAVGDLVRLPTPGGESSFSGIVRETGESWVLLDFNHPLAGRPVTFEVQLIGVL